MRAYSPRAGTMSTTRSASVIVSPQSIGRRVSRGRSCGPSSNPWEQHLEEAARAVGRARDRGRRGLDDLLGGARRAGHAVGDLFELGDDAVHARELAVEGGERRVGALDDPGERRVQLVGERPGRARGLDDLDDAPSGEHDDDDGRAVEDDGKIRRSVHGCVLPRSFARSGPGVSKSSRRPALPRRARSPRGDARSAVGARDARSASHPFAPGR